MKGMNCGQPVSASMGMDTKVVQWATIFQSFHELWARLCFQVSDARLLSIFAMAVVAMQDGLRNGKGKDFGGHKKNDLVCAVASII